MVLYYMRGGACSVRTSAKGQGALTWEDSAGGCEEEDEELELDDPPLVLELVLGSLGVGDDVCGGLQACTRKHRKGQDLDVSG